MNFDINVLAESRIKKNSVSPINIEPESYSIEHTSTEIAAEGAFNKRLSYQPIILSYLIILIILC